MRDNLVNLTPFRDHTPSLAHRLASGLVKIGVALNRHDRRTAGSNGLGLTQTKILEFLRQCPKRSARLSAIAKGLSITPATASESVRTLIQKGLVRKVRSETDERVVIITLSAKGRRKADHAAGQKGFLIAAAESLTPPEQEDFLKTLLKMMLVIQERRHAPASRMCPSCQHLRPRVNPDSQRSHHCESLDTPFGNRQLQIDCPEHQPAITREHQRAWSTAEGQGVDRSLAQHPVLDRSNPTTTRS